jgi:hypothetical protein
MVSIVRLVPANSNIDSVLIMDAARRRLNYLGPPGWRAMAGQTDDLFRARGYPELARSFLVGSPISSKYAATH